MRRCWQLTTLVVFAAAAPGCRATGDLVRAEKYLEAGRYGRALDEYEVALELYPNDGMIHFQLGLTLERLDRPAEAIPHFQKARELDERPLECLAREAACLQATGAIDEAIASLRKAITRAPKGAPLWEQLGLALVAAGKYVAARQTLHRALELNPKQAEATLALGRLYDAKLGDPGRAVVLFDRFLALWRAHPESGAVAERRGVLVAADPRLAGGYEEVAAMKGAIELFDEGKYAEAAAELRPVELRDSGSYYLLGRSCLLMNDVACGVEALRRAVELAPKEPTYLLELIRILQVVGASEEADRLVADGRRLFPKDRAFVEADGE